MAATEIIQDQFGNNSSTRVMFIIIIFYSMFMTTLVWFHTKDYVGTLAMFTAISGLGTALKLGQKQIEKTTQPVQ
jgi:hypothetical protein